MPIMGSDFGGIIVTEQSVSGPVYLAPAFTAFAIAGQAAVIEVGDSVAGGSRTFTWSTSNSGNVAANSIAISDTTAGSPLGTGLANDGSQAISISTITHTSPATQLWTIQGTNTHGGNFSRGFSVAWEWKVYAGTNANPELFESDIEALSDYAQLTGTFARQYTYAGMLGFKYLCYPNDGSMGSIASVTDANTGFPVDMVTVATDAAYSHQANGIYYALVGLTNAHGVTVNYRVYRTAESFSGAFKITVN